DLYGFEPVPPAFAVAHPDGDRWKRRPSAPRGRHEVVARGDGARVDEVSFPGSLELDRLIAERLGYRRAAVGQDSLGVAHQDDVAQAREQRAVAVLARYLGRGRRAVR